MASLKLKYKPDFEESLSRIEAWYRQEIIDRAPVRFYHHNIEYERFRTIDGPWSSPEERWLDVDFQIGAFLQSLDTGSFAGETFPVFWPNLSAVAYNLFLGQKPVFNDETAWIHPVIKDLDDLPELKVQNDNIYFQTVEKLTRCALDRCEDSFLVGYTDMYGGIDCTAGLRGSEAMCLDLLMNPQGIQELINKAYREYPEIYDQYDSMLKDYNQLSVTWMNLPCRDRFNVLACDFAVNISTDHFDEFCMPILKKEAEYFTHNIFHVDGPGVAKNIESILTLPNMPAIQWVQGYGKDQPVMQWVHLIKRVQEAGKSIIVDIQLEELEEFIAAVDPIGIMLWVSAEQKDQEMILHRVSRW
jgi:hypothetical protein